MTKLRDQIPIRQSSLNILPLFHTCEAYNFRNVLYEGHLHPIRQEKYGGDELLFFFYGKPSYRSGSMDEANKFHSALPCCLIFNDQSVPGVKEVFPFDTGAFKAKIFAAFFNKAMKLEDFSLGNKVEDLAAYVEYMFSNNYSYFQGDVKPVLDNLPSMAFEMEHLFELARSRSEGAFDDRASSCEVMVAQSVRVNENSIGAIILPGVFVDDPTVLTFASENPETKIYTYKIHRGRVSEYHSEIRKLASIHIFGE